MVAPRMCVLVLALSACGPSTVAEAEQGEICGEPGPFRILALDEDEMPASVSTAISRVGDRIYFTIGDAVSEADAPFSDNGFTQFTPLPENPRILSTGLCGETPRLVAEGVEFATEDDRWPGAALGRLRGTSDYAVLDPDGLAPPRLFLPHPGLPFERCDVGVVGMVADSPEAATARAVLQPYPASVGDDPPPQVTVLEDVVNAFGTVQARGTEVFALTSARALVRVDLIDGANEVLAEDVDGFDVTQDTRFVVLFRALDGAAEPSAFATTILDRDTGDETWVADSTTRFPSGAFAPNYFLTIEVPGGKATRIVEFPSLETHDTPVDTSVHFRIQDDLFLGTSRGEHITYDVSSGETRVLFAGYGARRYDMEGIVVLDSGGGAPYRTTGGLFRALYTGGEPRRIAERATSGYTLMPDGRVITPLHVDADYLGTLVIVDPDTLQEQRIDEDVVSINANLAAEGIFDDGVIAYAVRDGDRSGIWLARPAL